MNQPTKTEVIGAVKWVVEFITDHISEDEADDVGKAQEVVRILRAALEQMNRTVSDTDVLADKVALAQLIAKDKLYHELIMAVETKYPNESRHATAWRYIREREERRDLGIEVEGETPDDKFNNEKDQ